MGSSGKAVEKLMRLTYLTPRHQYLTKMSRVRFHQIQAIEKITDLVWSGPGWDNYNDSLTVTQNLHRLYNGSLPDMVIIFDHRPMLGVSEIPIPKCLIMNEMHGPGGERKSSLRLIQEQNYDLVICHHKNEMELPCFSDCHHKFVNISHCANNLIFKDYEYEKEWDVICCGSLYLDKYLLRRRFPRIIDKLNQLGYKCKTHKHPGGHHADSYTDRYLVDFAKEINKSKICLTCSSIYKCSFGKYVEIPMCRSLLAGDIPDERQEFFRKFMLVIENSDSDDAIIEKLINQLKNDGDLKYKTDLGYKLNHQDYTMEKYADRFLAVVKKYFSKKYI